MSSKSLITKLRIIQVLGDEDLKLVNSRHLGIEPDLIQRLIDEGMLSGSKKDLHPEADTFADLSITEKGLEMLNQTTKTVEMRKPYDCRTPSKAVLYFLLIAAAYFGLAWLISLFAG